MANTYGAKLGFGSASSHSVEKNLSSTVIPTLIVIFHSFKLCSCESALPGRAAGICLVVFKAEVLVSFRNDTALTQSALREPRYRWIISVLSFLLRGHGCLLRGSASTVKPSKVIPAVKALHLRFALSPLIVNLQHSPFVFLQFILLP